MPKLGLTMTEGVLAEWHVKPGDRVEPGQVMFVVETDKIANEIEAPSAGEIVEILVGSGETVPVGAPLARWTGKGAVGNGAGEAAETAAAAPAPQAHLSPSPSSLGPMAQQWRPSPKRRGGRPPRALLSEGHRFQTRLALGRSPLRVGGGRGDVLLRDGGRAGPGQRTGR